MTVLEAILLGIVQGVTEFLPVSSSGHLVLAETILRVPTPGVFIEVALHVATLLSVAVVYRRRLAALLAGAARREPDALRFLGLLALATLPAGLVGLTLREPIERIFHSPALVGTTLLLTGTLLWSTRWAPRRPGRDHLTWSAALLIGTAQALAILPGISRSGATIAAALWAGLRAERAAEFSFLLALPAIAGAALLEAPDLAASLQQTGTAAMAAGFAAALVTGIASIVFLVWLLRRSAFAALAFYLWAVGGLTLLYLWLGG